MSGIVHNFFEFLQTIDDRFDFDDVDMSMLKDQNNCFMPIQLKSSDPEAAYRCMAGVIILNLFKNYDNYPKYGLKTIQRIFTKNSDEEDNKIKLMLLVHISKMSLQVHLSAYYCKKIEIMKTKIELTAQLETWKNVACKVLAHGGINEIINNLMEEYLGTQYSERIRQTDAKNVTVHFVNYDVDELRGFSGLNSIFINVSHFNPKMLANENFVDIENVMKMDIATVSLHEYAHVRIRQVLDDFNMSTPNLITDADALTIQDLEFGRITEKRFFTVAVNWIRSLGTGSFPPIYIESFLNAINSNTALPQRPPHAHFIKRNKPVVMNAGTDFGFMNEIC